MFVCINLVIMHQFVPPLGVEDCQAKAFRFREPLFPTDMFILCKPSMHTSSTAPCHDILGDRMLPLMWVNIPLVSRLP